MAAAAEAAAAALPSEGQGGVHFAIPEGTTTIKGLDFMGRGEDSLKEWGLDKTEVTHVTIPSSVTRIGGCAFDGCSALTSLEIPSFATSTGVHKDDTCSRENRRQSRSRAARSVDRVDGWLVDGRSKKTSFFILLFYPFSRKMKWKVVPQEVVLHININAKVESKDECSGIPCKYYVYVRT